MAGRDPAFVETNNEQRDEDQAQDIADELLSTPALPSEETERGGSSDPSNLIPEDVPDLVEKMNDMVQSGRLDFDAFAGEPMHDDEEDVLGRTDSEDEEDVLGQTDSEDEEEE